MYMNVMQFMPEINRSTYFIVEFLTTGHLT